MKTLNGITQILRTHKPYLAETYGVREIGVFGSYVRGEQRPDSDVDILVELERPPKIGLMGLVGLELYLTELLVDLRRQYPDIPWKRMAGMRDRIVHGYDTVDLEVIWDAVKREIPQVKPRLQQILIDYEGR